MRIRSSKLLVQAYMICMEHNTVRRTSFLLVGLPFYLTGRRWVASLSVSLGGKYHMLHNEQIRGRGRVAWRGTDTEIVKMAPVLQRDGVRCYREETWWDLLNRNVLQWGGVGGGTPLNNLLLNCILFVFKMCIWEKLAQHCTGALIFHTWWW